MARRRSGKKIDFVHWVGVQGQANGLSAGSVALTLLAAQHDPETALRLRGEWTCRADTTQAPGGAVQISVGCIYVPEGTGTTVLWSPFTDADAPWLWWDSATIAYEEMVTDVIDIPQLTGVRRVIDNKAMRIVRNSELQFVIENVTLQTAMAVNTTIAGRMLSGT